MNDVELIQQWCQGDESAFATIYDRYVLKLLVIAMDKTRDRVMAEELVNDTFITFYKFKPSSHKLNSVLAFLYIVLKNKILDMHRQRLAEKKRMLFISHSYTEQDDSTRALIETRELERLLNDEIEKLPEQCRRVFNMRNKEFKTNREVAAALAISENTVEQHMRKARRLLRISFINHDILLLTLLISQIIQ